MVDTTRASPPAGATILVWDLPVRLGHWLMAGGFALAWLTAESETWRLVHVLAGGMVVAVALFRLAWGLVGSRHARFGSFVRGPMAALGYLKSLATGRPQHWVGHNPAGGWAILALLALALLTGGAGWLSYQDLAGEWLEEVHEALASAMLAVVAIHQAGVAVGSLAHRENLPRAMVTGRKRGPAAEAIAGPKLAAALVLLAWTAIAAWWLAR